MKSARQIKRKRAGADNPPSGRSAKVSVVVSSTVAQAIADGRRRDALERQIERRKEKAKAAAQAAPEAKVVAVADTPTLSAKQQRYEDALELLSPSVRDVPELLQA